MPKYDMIASRENDTQMLTPHDATITKMLRVMDELERVAAELDAPAQLIHDLPAIVAIYYDGDQHRPVALQ